MSVFTSVVVKHDVARGDNLLGIINEALHRRDLDDVVAVSAQEVGKMVATGADMRIDHDDHLEDCIEKVNKALEKCGIAFVDDAEEHDGFCLYQLETV